MPISVHFTINEYLFPQFRYTSDFVERLLGGPFHFGPGAVFPVTLPFNNPVCVDQSLARLHSSGQDASHESQASDRPHSETPGLRQRHEQTARGRTRVRLFEGHHAVLRRSTWADVEETGGEVSGEVVPGVEVVHTSQLS